MNNRPSLAISENLGSHYNLYKTIGSNGNFRRVTKVKHMFDRFPTWSHASHIEGDWIVGPTL